MPAALCDPRLAKWFELLQVKQQRRVSDAAACLRLALRLQPDYERALLTAGAHGCA